MDAEASTEACVHSSNWIGDLPITGPEDIAIDREAEVAYISSQDRRAAEWLIPGLLRQRATEWSERGRIYRVDLRNGLAAEEMPVRVPSGAEFHPAGIDLYVGSGGERRLFVVNVGTSTDFSIEIFNLINEGWSHEASATTSGLTLPNDVAAVSEKAFYVSNSLTMPPVMQGLEKAFCIPTGNVLFHDIDSRQWQRVVWGIPYANGLALDRKRGRLFVASTLSYRLLAFPWNSAKPGEAFSTPDTLLLPFMPDNLCWEEEDTLWAAGSEYFKSIPYTLALSNFAPSHVARIRLAKADPGIPLAERAKKNPFKGVSAQCVYDNDGSQIAQCSVAAPYHRDGECRFLVGSCFDDHASAFREAA